MADENIISDENKTAFAKQVYNTLCESIEKRSWTYEKNDETMFINFTVIGKELPMRFAAYVDVKRQVARFVSRFPFKFSENKRLEGAIASCVAGCKIDDGSFDYNAEDGTVSFRITASFRESQISDALFQYIISCACSTIESYNGLFLSIEEGKLVLNDFIKKFG